MIFDFRCCRRYSSRGTQTPLTSAKKNPEERRLSYQALRGKTIFAAFPFAPKPPQPSNNTVSEEKASRVLGVVFSTFVVCWAPFFILNLVVGLCGNTCSPPSFLFEMALWLGYSSSTINPLIYTVFNIKFRRSFQRLLSCKRAYSTSNNNSSSF